MAWLRTLVFNVFFYVGSLFLVLLCFPALIFPGGVKYPPQWWSTWHRWCVTGILGIKIVVDGEIPAGQKLYAVKHESFFEAIDSPHLSGGPIVPFGKIQLLSIPLWGQAARHYGVIGVDREAGAKALRSMGRQAAGLKKEGRDFLLFPEGTRVGHGERGKIQSGLYGIYKLLGLPIVPIAVNSGPLYQPNPKRRGTITYKVGETIPPGLSRDEVEARVFEAINALNPPE